MNTVNESRIAELWVELAGLDLTTEKGQQKNKAIRKELIELVLAATWPARSGLATTRHRARTN